MLLQTFYLAFGLDFLWLGNLCDLHVGRKGRQNWRRNNQRRSFDVRLWLVVMVNRFSRDRGYKQARRLNH
jgi:hypothetical protein